MTNRSDDGEPNRRRILLAAICLLVAAALLISTPSTLAAWQDPERGTATFTGGTVAPPTGLSCTGGLARFDLHWTLPAGGATRTGYSWTATPRGILGPTGSGTISDPSAATLALTGGGLLTLGTATFQLRATGTGGWQSPPVTATLTVVLGLITSCTVP